MGRVFPLVKSYFCKNGAKKKKMKKMEQFSGTHISQITAPISFKFGMYGRVYGGHN